MKIKKIKLINNPILGNIEFDFCDKNGLPFDTIILAGENGTGKSTLLNLIYEFMEFNLVEGEEDVIQEFIFELNKEEFEIILKNDSTYGEKEGEDAAELKVIKKFSLNPSWNDLSVEVINNGNSLVIQSWIFSRTEVKDIFRVIFSDVEVNYNTGAITTISNLDIDSKEVKRKKSTNNLATEIAQLLIDIEALDSSEFTAWASRNLEKTVSEGVMDRRMRRFKDAFHFMFPKKEYSKIINTPSGKSVIFTENGKEIYLNNLSSGEKQIVFRGSFLLKDKHATTGSLAIIDEPEISLHPSWQIKILDFYKNLFRNEEGNLTSQLIVATHSPFVIHNQNQIRDRIIILEKNKDGIVIEKDPTFFGWVPEQVVRQAFNISLNEDKEDLRVFVEGITDEIYINTALKIFDKNRLPIKVRWIGRNDGAGDKFSGDSALNHTKEYLISNSDIIEGEFLLLYDSDTKVINRDYIDERVFIRKVPFNSEQPIFKKGIENLLTIPKTFDLNKFYKTLYKKDDYGGDSTVRVLDKVDLCEYICHSEELNDEERKQILIKIDTEIISIIEDRLPK